MAENLAPLPEHVMGRVFGAPVPPKLYYRSDWSDLIAAKAAREVLRDVQFPRDRVRRSLYAQWLRVFATHEWNECFDRLILECVVATPSPTVPGTSLFANIFEAHDPVDTVPPRSPVLNLRDVPRLFTRKLEKIEPLPSSQGFVAFVADLIRNSRFSRAALDEAGLIIGFMSLAFALVAAKPLGDVQYFFRTQMRRALTAASVPLSFDGNIPWPNSIFLAELVRKVRARKECVIKPCVVVLVLGQYAYHVNANNVTSRGTRVVSADQRFLEEAFLTPAMYGHLEVIELLYNAQDKLGVSAATLNRNLWDSGEVDVSKSSEYVQDFLREAQGPLQVTRPWCRVSNLCFFSGLDLSKNLDYALRLTALLAPDPNDFLWQREEFTDIPRPRRRAARIWARDFKHSLVKEKSGVP